MEEQLKRWQQRIDETFPHGAVISPAEHPHKHSFVTPRPEVVSLHGMDPVVFLDFPLYGRNISGAITGWEPVQDTPCKLVRVTMHMGHGEIEPLLWSANLSDAQKEQLRPDRRDSLERSKDGTIHHPGWWFGEEVS